ncbi:hypothetical protein J3R83DRAFT_4018 [Lanmaoa asiatica]|nr:hypothetical protein J3R83DRAFT_4018 [Lanmaoa asiatica]
MATTGLIEVRTKYIAPTEATLPALGVHVTRLVDSYMIWVGVTEETAETVEDAPRRGSLCRDWACAMPSTPGSAQMGPATTLYRISGSDVALSMAQRLAKRVRKVVFLSVDLDGTRLLMDAEKGIIDTVLELERSSPLSGLSQSN